MTTSYARRAPGTRDRLADPRIGRGDRPAHRRGNAARLADAARLGDAARRPPTRLTAAARRPHAVTRSGRRSIRRDRGSASVEFLGFLPILLLVALAGVQLGLVAYAGTQAGTAARAAARTDDQGAAARSVSGWLHPRVTMVEGPDSVTAIVTIPVPSVLPGLSIADPVTRRATMPRE
jgi:hypothetical protein